LAFFLHIFLKGNRALQLGIRIVAIIKTSLALLTLLTATTASAIEVFLHQVAPIPGTSLIENIAPGQYPGTLHYQDPVTLAGLSMSAYFEGQVPGVVTIIPPPPTSPPNPATFDYETITGQPTGGLILKSQGINRNIQVEDLKPFYADRLVYGLLDVPDSARGAISMLFDYNVDTVGLKLIGANTGDPGNAYFRFYDADGKPFQFQDSFGNLVDYLTVVAYDGPLYFRSLDRLIRGITITTDDYAGLGYSTVVFAQTPAPPSFALLSIGLTFFKVGRRLQPR
jgi:hypothetical protein